MQASPTGILPVGATPRGSPSSAASVPASAPETAPEHPPAPSASPATATGTNGYVMQPGVTRAVTRSQVRSPVAIDYRANRNNRAAVAGFFQNDALQKVHKQQYFPKLRSHANLDILTTRSAQSAARPRPIRKEALRFPERIGTTSTL